MFGPWLGDDPIMIIFDGTWCATALFGVGLAIGLNLLFWYLGRKKP